MCAWRTSRPGSGDGFRPVCLVGGDRAVFGPFFFMKTGKRCSAEGEKGREKSTDPNLFNCRIRQGSFHQQDEPVQHVVCLTQTCLSIPVDSEKYWRYLQSGINSAKPFIVLFRFFNPSAAIFCYSKITINFNIAREVRQKFIRRKSNVRKACRDFLLPRDTVAGERRIRGGSRSRIPLRSQLPVRSGSRRAGEDRGGNGTGRT